MTKIAAVEDAALFSQIIRDLVEDQPESLFCPEDALKKKEEKSRFVRAKFQIA